MKPETSLKKRVLNLILGAALLLTASCDYFDITRDKDGNKITLISIDLPEFDASYSIRVRELWFNTNPSRSVYVELSGQSEIGRAHV